MTWFTRAGSAWVRWQLSRRDLYTVDIGTALREGGRALILLPSNPKHLPAGLAVAEKLNEWFHPVNTIWMGLSGSVPDIADAGVSVTSIPNAVNRWGLPYTPLVEKITQMAPQVAIDLNPKFLQASAYLCVVSGARLRIGFHGSKRGFFNLQYTWPSGDDLALTEHYDGFLNLLAQLRSSPVS